MGHSLTLLTAVLFVGQSQVLDANGKKCPCKDGQQQGRVLAEPEVSSEMRTVGWMNWRNSSTTSTKSESWTSTPQETSWVDNRPVLSRIKGWFNRGDNSNTIRNETVQPQKNQPMIVQPNSSAPENYRRLPTTNEPPLGTTPSKPAVQPRPVITTPQKQISPANEKPLTIEIEPIEFRPAGSAKGVAPAMVVPLPAPIAAIGAPSSRPSSISERFANKVGQPGDYSWITGQLEVRGNTYVIHYATPETVDRFEGSLVLSADAKLMGNVRNGDLVSLHGTVVQQSGRNVYRVQTIDLIER